jgi:hypothetical protein
MGSNDQTFSQHCLFNEIDFSHLVESSVHGLDLYVGLSHSRVCVGVGIRVGILTARSSNTGDIFPGSIRK